MSERKFLCLFSSEALRRESCFGENGGWRDRTDAGACDFVPHVLDGDVPALAHSGLFAATTFLVRPSDLGNGEAERDERGRALRAFVRPGLSFEIVATDSAIDLVRWLGAAAPELLSACRQDGEVRFESFGWWRSRAERHFSADRPAVAEAETGDDPSPEALRAFVSRRRGGA